MPQSHRKTITSEVNRPKPGGHHSLLCGAKFKKEWIYNITPIRLNPGGGEIFPHVQTGPVAHPASCTMGTGSFPGVKRQGRGAGHSPPSSAEVTKG
jgi:hypothetical protein